MDIFGWAADNAGCRAFRLTWPLAEVAKLGHTVDVMQRMPRPVLDGDQVIIGQRVCKPEPSALWQHLAARGRTVVYELDDDLFTIDPSNEIAHGWYLRPEIQANIRANIRVASAVFVSTGPLAEVVRPINPRVHVLPNRVPARLLDRPAPTECGLPFVGWAGSPTHRLDFAECGPSLRQVLRRNPGVMFHAMGADYSLEHRLPADQTARTGWVDSIDGFHDAVDFDVALCPLRPSVFNRSKSPIKALEAMALGIPVVASDVGPYPGVVEHGVTGFLVRHPHEWSLSVQRLLDSPDLRQQMGAAARQAARDHVYDDTAGKQWLAALEEANR